MVGGGLVGLATAMHLVQVRPQSSIHLIEKDSILAGQQSGHNSGVLHAGIYYKPGSRKARFCVTGNRALATFCAEHAVPLIRCGKVIVASTEEDAGRLDRLYAQGTENGVPGLRIVSSVELREIEPNVVGEKALHAPHSSIVDFKKVAATYADLFRTSGGNIHLDTAFESAVGSAGQHRVTTSQGEFQVRMLVNCAGLHSDWVARRMGGSPDVRIIPFRGEYYLLREDRRHLVKGLIYPVPDPSLPFLGVHFTPRVNGDVEAGPNAVLATKREGYRRRDFSVGDIASTLSWPGFWWLAARNIGAGIAEINRSLRKSAFVKSLRRLVPEIQAEDLLPGGSGVRAQAVDRRGNLVDDFRIEESPGAIHLLNAPSPAATASLIIGRHIAELADRRMNGR